MAYYYCIIAGTFEIWDSSCFSYHYQLCLMIDSSDLKSKLYSHHSGHCTVIKTACLFCHLSCKSFCKYSNWTGITEQPFNGKLWVSLKCVSVQESLQKPLFCSFVIGLASWHGCRSRPFMWTKQTTCDINIWDLLLHGSDWYGWISYLKHLKKFRSASTPIRIEYNVACSANAL